MLSAIETWAPRYIAPPRGNRLGTDELADVPGGRDGRYESRIADGRFVYSARYAAASFRAFTTRYESVKWFSPCANESESSSHRPSSTHFRTTESRRNNSTSRNWSKSATVVSTPMKETSKRLSSSRSVIASS